MATAILAMLLPAVLIPILILDVVTDLRGWWNANAPATLDSNTSNLFRLYVPLAGYCVVAILLTIQTAYSISYYRKLKPLGLPGAAFTNPYRTWIDIDQHL
jgi:hypothetical protein